MMPPKTPPTQGQIRNAWDKIAPGFDRFTTPMNFRLGEEALRHVELRPGMRFLDVAAGSGALSLPAARRGAEVVATDIAPTMIECLNARAREDGLANLEGRVMDGYALDLEDDAFDIAASQNGVSLFPDLQAGLSEMVRVTKPGGRVLIVAFGPLQKAEWLGFFMGGMQIAVPGFTGLPTDPPPLPFQLANPARLQQEMAEVGLGDLRVVPANWRLDIRSGSHLFDVVTNSNPIGAMLVADLTQAQRDGVKQALDDMLRERSGEGASAVLNCQMNIGVGTK